MFHQGLGFNFVIGGGVENDRRVPGLGTLAQLANKLEAIHGGHEKVRNDKIGSRRADFRDRVQSVLGLDDVMAGMTEQNYQILALLLPIVSNKYGRHLPPASRS